MSNSIRPAVCEIIEAEFNLANEKFPPFKSAHEGYAVMLEEVEECQEQLDKIKDTLNQSWAMIKRDYAPTNVVSGMKENAINLAVEAIQVAAMCKKFVELDGIQK